MKATKETTCLSCENYNGCPFFGENEPSQCESFLNTEDEPESDMEEMPDNYHNFQENGF